MAEAELGTVCGVVPVRGGAQKIGIASRWYLVGFVRMLSSTIPARAVSPGWVQCRDPAYLDCPYAEVTQV